MGTTDGDGAVPGADASGVLRGDAASGVSEPLDAGKPQTAEVTGIPVDLPSTPLVREAVSVVEPLLSPALLHHSYRTYRLGALYGRQRGLRFDDEGLLVASLFHDVGLVQGRRERHVPFTRASADVMAEHLLGASVAADRVRRLSTAVEFHFQLRPRWALGPEAGLLQVGAWMDATGLRSWRLPRSDRRDVRARHPRRGFQLDFQRRLLRACSSPRATYGLLRPAHGTSASCSSAAR